LVDGESHGDRLPLAVCQAALAALGAMSELVELTPTATVTSNGESG
jgi:hypothetical protein